MKIIKAIELMKANACSAWGGKEPLDEKSTRDQILYGDVEQECTGIVSTCYATYDVIRQAGEMGYNFIVVHEALFWNHGDRTDWLENNTAFQKKKALLNQYHICVWRNHDHLHMGIPVNGQLRDGIFSGVDMVLGWEEYRQDEDAVLCQKYRIPAMTVAEMNTLLMQKSRLRGVRFIGNPDCEIHSVYFPLHLLGRSSDNRVIEEINDEHIDCLITMEMVDFTVCEYVRDAAMAGENKCIFALGHFNVEELGMEFYADYLQKNLIREIPVVYIQSGETYSYMS